MISARQRGTARAAIERFNTVAEVNQQALKNSGSQTAATSTATAEPLLDAPEGITDNRRVNCRIKQNVIVQKFDSRDALRRYELSSIRHQSGARSTIEKFNKVAEINQEQLNRNPFSDSYTVQRFDTKSENYGRPPKGSKTEARGIKAGVHIMREVLFLMETINSYAKGDPPDRIIKFGRLFSIYENYSNTLVGMLLRARKYNLVDFKGEMLYQRQDDDKDIRMLKSIEEIRELVKSSNDPVNCIAVKTDQS